MIAAAVPLFGDLVRVHGEGSPRRTALTFGDRVHTFATLDAATYRTAHALAGLGVTRGARLVWWGETGFRPIELFLATASIGVAFAPANPAFSDEELAPILDYVGPQVVVTDVVRSGRAAALLEGSDVTLAVVDTAEARVLPGLDLDELTAAASDRAPTVELRDDDVHPIWLTSGSTGLSKGVCVTQAGQWIRTMMASRLGGGTAGFVNMFPLVHYAGYTFFLKAWLERRATHLVPRADADELLGACERWRASAMYCIPAVWERVLEAVGRFDASSLQSVPTGTSLVTQELLHRLKEAFPGSTTTVSYGSTEVGGGLALPDHDLFRKPGSVGMPTVGLRARVADDGELQITGPGLMSGYHDRPEATAAAFDEGWYRTGDLAEVDDDGYHRIVGRTSEALRSGGEWVSPAEIEQALRSCELVDDVAVVGVDDDRWGEVVCAVVVPADPARVPTVAQLRSHLGGTLASYKHPRLVVSVESLPRTAATGQIQRSKLRDHARSVAPSDVAEPRGIR